SRRGPVGRALALVGRRVYQSGALAPSVMNARVLQPDHRDERDDLDEEHDDERGAPVAAQAGEEAEGARAEDGDAGADRLHKAGERDGLRLVAAAPPEEDEAHLLEERPEPEERDPEPHAGLRPAQEPERAESLRDDA